MSGHVTLRIWRGDSNGGDFQSYDTTVDEGMVVLDAVHMVQAEQAQDLACRWNCKAGNQRQAAPHVHDAA
jgi:succinate dehydrogenase / fumarate reductase iron-sulfur subunit